jgi:hypothetical protein
MGSGAARRREGFFGTGAALRQRLRTFMGAGGCAAPRLSATGATRHWRQAQEQAPEQEQAPDSDPASATGRQAHRPLALVGQFQVQVQVLASTGRSEVTCRNWRPSRRITDRFTLASTGGMAMPAPL